MTKILVRKKAHFSGHKGAIFSIEKSIHANCIYSGGDDGYVAEWDLETKGDGKLVANVPRPVYALLADDERKLLFCGTAAGNLHVVDLQSGKEVRNIEAHTLGLYSICKHGNALFTSGGDGAVCVWSLPDMQLLHRQQFSDKSARIIALHPRHNLLAVGYSDHKIRLASQQLQLLHTIDAHSNSVFGLAWDGEGRQLLSGGRDVMLKSWDSCNQYTCTLNVPAHTLHINSIAYNPSATLFATASMDKTIKIWAAESHQLIKVIDKARNDAHINSVNKIVWLSDLELATCSDDKQLMIWELEWASNHI
jgi:WD repeat-containing protein 61